MRPLSLLMLALLGLGAPLAAADNTAPPVIAQPEATVTATTGAAVVATGAVAAAPVAVAADSATSAAGTTPTRAPSDAPSSASAPADAASTETAATDTAASGTAEVTTAPVTSIPSETVTTEATVAEAPPLEPTEPPSPGQPLLSMRGTDLARQPWYASAALPPDASAERVRREATPTTVPVNIRSEAGARATLFTIIELAEKPAGGGLVTIGDMEGDDETFFNGARIGATSGRGITDAGVPRLYWAGNLQKGDNVLAVRLSSRGPTTSSGTVTLGIRRQPVTFGLVSVQPRDGSSNPTKPAGGVTAISPKDALDAISAADALTATAKGELRRKRPSFGRFGQILNDGLPAISEISPTHVTSRGGPRLDVVLDRVESAVVATDEREPGIDGWHKLVRVSGALAGKPVGYTMLQHLMYPGGILTLDKARVLQLRLSFPNADGVVQQLPDADAERLLPGSGAAGLTLVAAFEPRARSAPAVLAVVGAAANIAQDGENIDITVSAGKQPGKIYYFFPAGLKLGDLSSRPSDWRALARAVEPAAEPWTAIGRWLRVGLHEPVACDEYFHAKPDAGVVTVYQLIRHAAPAGVKVGEPYVWLPPQLEFAREHLSYPANCPATTDTGILSFSGPVHNVLTTTATPATAKGLRVVRYDLPIPPMTERGLIATPDARGLTELINTSLGDLASTAAVNGVDAFYKGRAQGFQAISYFDEGHRKRLLENSLVVVPLALRDSLWYEETEPFSGIHWWWTYFIEGPYFDRYDQDWGNGLSLYGFYIYTKYTGEWEVAAKNWAEVERMWSWFAASDDWEWMRASNGRHGHGTGAGDCTSADYAACLSYARLGLHTGRTAEYHDGLYAAARAAVSATTRFAYNDFAAANGFKPADSVVIGFHEGQGFLVGELDRYPWNATSNISGNGVQPENFDLYAARAPDALKLYEASFERAYPRWFDGAFDYGFRTLYGGNSGYITLPHIYLRARLGMETFDSLADKIASARANTRFWWLGPPVLAEILNMRNPLYVKDWGRCAFLGGEVRGDKGRRRIEARFDNKYPPDTVEIQIGHQPAQVEINGGPVPLTDSRFEGGVQWLRLRRPGVNTVTLWL